MQEFSEFLSEGGGELETSIRNNFVKKSEAKENFMEEKRDDSFGSNQFLSRAENYPLSKPMVYHDQERVKARGDEEICDKIAGELLEGAGGKGLIGDKGGMVGCVLTLFCWQVAHPSTYRWTNEASPGHQNFTAMSCRVLRKPGWPVDSWSWHRLRMAWQRESSAGI